MNRMGWRASWAIARRDLNSRIKGLRLLFVCLLLGVTTLAAIGSLTAAISDEIAGKGQILLGGDVEVGMSQREITAPERTALTRLGPVSTTIRMRAMAQRPLAPPGVPDTLLSELKGVDGGYPLYGRLTLQAGRPGPLGPDEILIAPELAERMALRPGDSLRYGSADFHVRGIIANEPDRMSEGFTLGPVALVSLDGLRRTALIQPGSLYESKYRLRLAPGADAKAVAATLKQRFPSAGWNIKDRDNAAPGASRFLERMGQFLSLIGLAALIIAGIGVSNGVGSYLNQKRNGIASLKVLGATSADIARIYLMQIGAVAGVAILLGLGIGALLPPVLGKLAGDMLPVQPGSGIHPAALASSAAYGLLIALAFTAIPLGRARTEPAAALLRGMVQQQARPDRQTLATIALCALAILLVALATSREPLFSAAMLAAVMLVLGLLWLTGRGIGWLAARLPRPRQPLWRLALANLYRPGAQTGALVVALGLAFTLFVTLASVRTSIDAEIRNVVPERAPNQFVLDIPMAQEASFRAIVKAQAPEAQLNVVPTLRGTIVAYGGQRVSALKSIPEGAWVLRGERGITYSATLPQGSTLVAGQWWPAGYRGPPQISLDQKVATVLGLKLGDRMSISILGREIEVEIASLREVKWESMGFNYAIVFDPATLRSAPHSLTATITMNHGREALMSRAVLAAFPSASIIATGDVVGQIQTLLGQMSAAITAAASVAIFAGIAVLVGAILASRQSRSYDSVILKTLGATRGQILQVQALEYVLLATILAALALLLGAGAGWYVVTGVFAFQWAPDWTAIATLLLGGIVITVGMGLAGSWPVLSIRPASALRDAI